MARPTYICITDPNVMHPESYRIDFISLTILQLNKLSGSVNLVHKINLILHQYGHNCNFNKKKTIVERWLNTDLFRIYAI